MASAILTENSAVSTTIHPESFGKISEHMAWVQALQYVSVMLVHLTALIEHLADAVHKHAVLQNWIIMPHTTKCATPLIALITNHDMTAQPSTRLHYQDTTGADFDLTMQK